MFNFKLQNSRSLLFLMLALSMGQLHAQSGSESQFLSRLGKPGQVVVVAAAAAMGFWFFGTGAENLYTEGKAKCNTNSKVSGRTLRMVSFCSALLAWSCMIGGIMAINEIISN